MHGKKVEKIIYVEKIIKNILRMGQKFVQTTIYIEYPRFKCIESYNVHDHH